MVTLMLCVSHCFSFQYHLQFLTVYVFCCRLARKLHYENKDEVLAKDANLKTDDWFDIHDPRSTLSKRRRENSKQDSKEKKRARINN